MSGCFAVAVASNWEDLTHCGQSMPSPDISYSLLVVMSWFGLVWDLKPVPARALEHMRIPADERA